MSLIHDSIYFLLFLLCDARVIGALPGQLSTLDVVGSGRTLHYSSCDDQRYLKLTG